MLPTGLGNANTAGMGMETNGGPMSMGSGGNGVVGGGSKRRRKTHEDGSEAVGGSEPRRLRRSHEACARCRSKKIKASPCDSKHPRCTACATAGTVCNQEDRHRQTLTPRGHTEHIEHQLAQCEALLKLRYPSFTLDGLDDLIAREGIDPASIQPPPPGQISYARPPAPVFHPPPHPAYPPYHPIMPGPYGPPYIQPPPNIHPFQHPGPYYPPVMPPAMPGPPPPPPPPPPAPPAARPPPPPSKGTDPNGNDMSNTEALAKNFGVSAAIVHNLLESAPHDREDLAVGSNTLTSGRDRSELDVPPRDAAQWIHVTARRNSTAGPPNTISLYQPVETGTTATVWLPKDRNMTNTIVDCYFTNLNLHRPVFNRKDLQKILDDLYDGKSTYDPGYICSIYLILALGTLSDLNRRAAGAKVDTNEVGSQHLGPAMAKKLMPATWPQHDEFFQRALAVKPDLRVTISSLQALILLHWYLYTERQGRTLWRLVGSLVRLSIELGLHHDPTTQLNTANEPSDVPVPQQNVFTEEECQLRIRLWGIVLIHDRGTSILLGRPLAISPSDTNTPRPTRPLKVSPADFSEHFQLSHPVAEIQADIINSLYTPNKQAPDTIMRNATRIIKSMSEFRRSMPDRYKHYFNGTDDWPLSDRIALVERITEDEGLTLLKLGIARILLLRALFSSKELSYPQRKKALVDAIITSHNTIIIHNQLIRFPDIAFFTSPIPLHIAAMVILYGQMSKVDCLPFNTALEDLWLALDLLPRFRWRWERKDIGGAHPLIARLAEKVMNVNLRAYAPSGSAVLMSEPDWETNDELIKSQQTSPVLSSAGPGYPQLGNGQAAYGPQPRSAAQAVPNSGPSGANPGGAGGAHSSGGSTPHEKPLVDVPTNLFYPFFPEDTRGVVMPNGAPDPQGYGHLLAQAGQGHPSSYGCQPSQDSYMSEERDIGAPPPQGGAPMPVQQPGMGPPPPHPQHQQQMWMNVL